MGGNRQIWAFLSNRVPTELRGARDKKIFFTERYFRYMPYTQKTFKVGRTYDRAQILKKSCPVCEGG